MPLDIGGRALDLLVALTSQAGQVLSKRELLQRVWPDTVVEEGSLRFHMTHLRRILGDDGAAAGRYIATQVGVGYAFVEPVERLQSAPDARAARTEAEPEPTPALPSPRASGNVGALPPRSPLIGREADVSGVLERLAEPKLLNIVGTGGVGKTSLAVEVGYRAAGAGHGRVCFVDLAQVEDAALVPSALAAAWGLPVQAEDPVFVLLAHLQSSRALLIIDNCEHVVATVCGIVERLREAAPNLCILATSREPLRARQEQVYRLGPLECPPAGASQSVAELIAYPAVELFVERASLRDAATTLGSADAQMIADMCLRLDGMALPIELAAVRAATHGIQATHALLGERFSLAWSGLRSALPRQQTLRATLDWSYELLSPLERLVFDRLGVFVGRFSLHAATEVLTDERIDAVTVAATLDELTAKGLVNVEHSAAVDSYRLLEMTRAYAKEKLAAHGPEQVHALAFRHATFHLEALGNLCGSPEEVFKGAAQLACQLGNLRSALEWSFGPQGDPGLALPLAAASVPVFLHFSLLVECRHWCARAIELLELGYFGTATEMELQAALGLVLMFTRGNSGAAEKALCRAMDLAVALQDHEAQLKLLGRLQIFHERAGNFAASLAWAERAVAVGETIGEPEAIAVAASLAGVSHHLLGDQRLARQELELALRNSGPSRRSQTIHYGFDHRNRTGLALARTLWLQGFPDQASRWAQRVEREAEALDHPVTYCIALVWTLCIYLWNGDLENASKSLDTFARIARANVFAPYVAATQGMRGALAIRAGEHGQAIGWLQDSLDQLHGMRYELLTTSFEIALAEGLVLAGRHGEALGLVEVTIAHCRHSGDAFALPELLRIKAGIVRTLGGDAEAVTLLDEALGMSRQQGARAWELRIVMDLAKVATHEGRIGEARALLVACGDWITEGFDTMDVRAWARARQAAIDASA
ncbi:MAG TPA: winged helix-turn-helix domain-containing protein [Stenotrophomonas sp.]|nr:winged helix-turn-helix domain-containing protein [Stenotrophomonas sp.]